MSSEDTKANSEGRDMETEEASPTKDEISKSSDGEEKEDVKSGNDTKAASSATDEGTDGDGETEEEEVKKPAKKRPVKASEEIKDEDEKETEEDEDDDEGADEDEKKNGVVEKESKKKSDRMDDDKKDKKEVEIEVPDGNGVPFGECPRIEHFIKHREIDQLKKLHLICFGRVGKPDAIRENLLKFKGFDYEPESDAYTKKKQVVAKLDFKHLREICDVLDVEKKGKKDEIVTRLMEFLMDPKDSGKPVPAVPAPRPKRTSAVKANNRGFAGLDADDSDEEEGGGGGGRRGRAAGRRAKARPSYKDESSSEEEKRGRRAGRKFSESDAESDPELTPSESDSDSAKKKKVAAVKPKGRGAPKRKAVPAVAKTSKRTPGKKGKKKASEESEGPSESEDEPLQKKSKKFPTDDEIKKYVKQILDGANLEEITMKTVCKQVYGRYPDHDLTHKKDLIKTTVKSLIAT